MYTIRATNCWNVWFKLKLQVIILAGNMSFIYDLPTFVCEIVLHPSPVVSIQAS